MRVADSASGLATICDDETVTVPLGLVALYWIRLFKPLIENDIPQMPAQRDNHGLAFVKAPFRGLADVSPFELRVGAEFHGTTGKVLAAAIKDAAQTIRKMPAFYITYPNSSKQVFEIVGQIKPIRSADQLTITAEYLAGFGQMRIPINIWQALSRYATWIEPSILFEWSELMQQYAQTHGKNPGMNELMQHLRWLDPERDTSLVRSIVTKLAAGGSEVYCVWSGKRLKVDRYDVDHCFPFSAWPCNDLWNLLPVNREINNNKKDKLVTTRTLNAAWDRIETWWNEAYFAAAAETYASRFRREAFASLPLVDADVNESFYDNMFDAMQLKRAGLKQNQNLTEWDVQ